MASTEASPAVALGPPDPDDPPAGLRDKCVLRPPHGTLAPGGVPVPSFSVLVATDKFKGSLRADEVAAHLTRGIVAGVPDARVVSVPIADGGEGTLVAAEATDFERVEYDVTGPNGEPVRAAIGIRRRVAIVELAAASGLSLVPRGCLDPLRATSRGTGELMLAALAAGCQKIILGVGGSACTDAGAGMLQALGASLQDAEGRELDSGGGPLVSLDRVDLSGLDPRLAGMRIVLASDVDNPLLGSSGAAYTYGPQKGASPDDLITLEQGLHRWADLVDPEAADRPGAGAAGGVGYTAMAVLGAVRRPGVDVVLDLVRFREHLEGVDLVITGEGRLDEQTFHGKAPVGVSAAAHAAGTPVVVVCGQRLISVDELGAVGMSQVYSLNDVEPDLEQCMRAPGPILERIGRRMAVDWARAAAGE